jgi:hypothetical protein
MAYFKNGTVATFPNGTLINPYTIDTDKCNTTLCPLEVNLDVNGTVKNIVIAQVGYQPSLGWNAAYLAIFAALLAAQVGLGCWYRTWGFLVAMVGGLLLEIIGKSSNSTPPPPNYTY